MFIALHTSERLVYLIIRPACIGGDLVQGFGGLSWRISAEIFFRRPLQNAKFGGRQGTHCLLELNVEEYIDRLRS